MAATTFGELLGPARAHLDAATGSGGELGGDSVMAAARVMSRIAGALSRYLADIAPYGVAEAIIRTGLDEQAWAALDAREALRMAAGSLRPRGGSPCDFVVGAPGPLVVRLEAASASLTAARDLLRTHFGTDADGQWVERSDWAAVITSEPVTRAVLGEVASWSRQLAFLTARFFLASAGDAAVPEPMHSGLAGACHWMLTASAALAAGQRGDPATAADMALLQAVPVNVAPPRRVPVVAEAVAELAEGVDVSAARLRAIAWTMTDQAAWSPAMTADSWQWTATGAAVICHVSELMLGSLAEHPGLEAGLPGVGPQLHAAAESAAQACVSWRKAAAVWTDMVTETPRSGRADLQAKARRVGPQRTRRRLLPRVFR